MGALPSINPCVDPSVFRAFVSEGATEFGDEGEGGKRHSGGEERRVTKHW